MARETLRVYQVVHVDGRVSGYLMRRLETVFSPPVPVAYGDDVEDVDARLRAELARRVQSGEERLEQYTWGDETFETRTVEVAVHPETAVGTRTVIGSRRIPLRLSYAHSELPGGGYRVMLPRFGWWLVLQDLRIAPAVLRAGVSGALLGEEPMLLYDFRREGRESVRALKPPMVSDPAGDDDDRPIPPVLASVATDLVAAAVRRTLPPVVGSLPGYQALPELIRHDPPRSVLLVGPSGAGKTTRVRRLAREIALWPRPRGAPRRRLWATSADRIMAGMKYLGMWQERVLAIVEALDGSGDVLFVDHLGGLTRPRADGASIAQLLLPALEGGDLPMIAECTPAELEHARRQHPALVRCFRVVRVPRATPAEMGPLLEAWQGRHGAGTTLHPAAVRQLVSLLDTFQRESEFPGKGFRFLDWLAHTGAPAATLYPRDVVAAFSRYTGLPAAVVADDQQLPASAIADRLAASVVGQPSATDAVAGVLARFEAGVNDPERPLGSLLFVGPTGVGKTELAKQTARFLFGDPKRLVRVDMSEYMLPGSAQRLLEAGSGRRSLATRVRRQPLSVVLLDEIEKAHPEVFDLLLGVLGEGRLTDDDGRLVDFRMALIVLTSNLGAADRGVGGFGGSAGPDFVSSVRRHFRPELFNRLDAVVPFRALAPEDVLRIVDLELVKVAARTGLSQRRLRLDVTPEARRALAELGWDAELGARPLRRVVEERVVTPIAVRLAAEPGLRGRAFVVRVEDGALTVGCEA